MAVLILSKTISEVKSTLDLILQIANTCDIESSVEDLSNQGKDILLSKEYEDQDAWMYLGIDSVDWVAEFSEIANIHFTGLSYNRLVATDHAKYDRLIYDFALNYLKLRPDDVICLHGSDFFTHAHLHELERTGGYRKDWCYPPYRN